MGGYVSKNPHWLRKYRITIYDESGKKALVVSDSDYENTNGPLKISFNIERPGYKAIYYGEIAIYNLSLEAEQAIINEGYTVVLEAGYVDGDFGVIFKGQVFQAVWDRQDVVDMVLTLNCIDGMKIERDNFVSLTIAQKTYQKDLIKAMAAGARNAITVNIDDQVDAKQLSRGRVYFGDPKTFLNDYALDNKCQYFMSDGEINIARVDSSETSLSQDEALVVSPENGLIGTPQQMNDAVSFRCLLNPKIKIQNPAMLVKLDQSLIRQQKIRQGTLVTRLDKDGLYRVAQVNHIGDTRGNDWYTEVIGVTFLGKLALWLDTAEQTMNGNG